jgi:hypothetical protein
MSSVAAAWWRTHVAAIRGISLSLSASRQLVCVPILRRNSTISKILLLSLEAARRAFSRVAAVLMSRECFKARRGPSVFMCWRVMMELNSAGMWAYSGDWPISRMIVATSLL